MKAKKPWRALGRGAKALALAVGATALCMLAFSGLFPGGEPSALEASVFNGGREFPSGEGAAPATSSSEDPGEVIPLGTAFGIRLFTDGVIVASLTEIPTENGACCPAQEAGIQPGDYILRANGLDVPDNAALARAIGQSAGQPVTLLVRRGRQEFQATVTPVYGEGSYKTGMWVRDSAAGIGTLTFYDPASGVFAGLGHGICDMDTSDVMALKSGEPAPITLTGILRGEADSPGQLRGYFSPGEPLGELLANTETGVYGSFTQAPQGQAVEVLPRDQVREGPVELLLSLDSSGPRAYAGEIVEIAKKDRLTKNLVVRVTDPALLQATGGIVQGMSGAPILQDGKLAGAVTHVFTEDPTSGYGIFAQTMVEQCRALGDVEER